MTTKRSPPSAAVCLMILSSTLRPTVALGFVSGPRTLSTGAAAFRPHTRRTELCAKTAANKKKKKKGGLGGGIRGGGGFGSPAKNTKVLAREDQDYSVFPALEDSVKQTLVPLPSGSSGEMNQEMHDRLAQIYGFGRFNYEEIFAEAEEAEDEEGSVSVSFDELLASGPSSRPSSSSSSSSLDLGDLLGGGGPSKPSFGSPSLSGGDLSDLITSATGGSASSSSSSTPTEEGAKVKKLDLSKLPPFPGVRVLHVDPCVLAVDDFFTAEECDACVALSSSPDKEGGGGSTLETRSKTVGKDSRAKAQRTSTTWFHNYDKVPELMAKASRLLGLDGIERWEEPQTVRYRKTEKFTWHLDALGPSEDLGARGGQRVATLLVYLTDLSEEDGGATMFRDLSGPDGESPLKMRPKKGSALVFFPAAGGIPNVPFDVRALHAGEVVSDESSADKWIAQLWLREQRYSPTAPPGNNHGDAADAINVFCEASTS